MSLEKASEEIEIIERRMSHDVVKYTVLKNDRVLLITYDKKIANKYKKETKDGIR